MKYYYDPTTGEFKYRSETDLIKWDLPYIEKSEPAWIWTDYRVNVETLELIYDPKPKNPRR